MYREFRAGGLDEYEQKGFGRVLAEFYGTNTPPAITRSDLSRSR